MIEIENEHHKVNEYGELEGLFTVKLEQGAFEDIWDKLDVIIGAYTKVHPNEMEACVRENIYLATGAFTATGEGKNSNLGLRHHARIPAGLMKVIEAYTPEVFLDSDLYQGFLQHYPGFRVFEKV